jgi:hypothetical protein
MLFLLLSIAIVAALVLLACAPGRSKAPQQAFNRSVDFPKAWFYIQPHG